MNITTEEPKGIFNLDGGAQNHSQKNSDLICHKEG